MQQVKKMGFMMVMVLCMIAGSGVTAHAEMLTRSYNDTIEPRWSYIESIAMNLTFSDLGRADCFSTITAQGTSYTCKVDATLYRLDGGTWTKLKSWSDTAKFSATIAGEYYVKKGHLYVLRTKFSVYNSSGKLLESHTEDYEKEYK